MFGLPKFGDGIGLHRLERFYQNHRIDRAGILLFEQLLMGVSNAIADRYFLQGSNAAPTKKLGGLA